MESVAQARFDTADTGSVTTAVLSAVATAAGVDPISVRPRLSEVIDPDALEQLFDGEQERAVAVEFEYGEWNVHIRSGVVTVTDGTGRGRSSTGSGHAV